MKSFFVLKKLSNFVGDKKSRSPMSYPLYIEASEETLRLLGEKLKPVSDDRFFYCLQGRKWKIEDVYNYNMHLQISYDYASKEYERMIELRKVYNLEYPTDHKRYFSTVAELMSKMRSTISAYKKNLDKFRPRKSKKGTTTCDPTLLHCGPYSQDSFGWEPYKDNAVRQMLDNMNKFLTLAGKIYDEAIGVVEDENAIRSNPDLACPCFERSYKRSVSDNRKLIEQMKEGNFNADHDIVKAMEDADDVRKLIASLFHEFTFPDFNFFSACKAIHDGRKAGMTDEESLLFGKGKELLVQRLHKVLDHILELAEQRKDVIGWEGRLSGKFLMHLLYWCGWDGSKNQQLLKYISNHCKGKIDVVTMGAIQAAKRCAFRLDNEERYRQQAEFESQIISFADTFLTTSPDELN